MTNLFRLGVVINPFAGIGGALAFKGSDGESIRQQALAQGASKLANEKMTRALSKLTGFDNLAVFTASGEMGEDCCAGLGLDYQVIYSTQSNDTTFADTENMVRELVAIGVDLILFAGGDGTARNVCAIVEDKVPVLGVPAGVKIHSGVYAVTPSAAGDVVAKMLTGELVSVRQAEVRDIDESAFREGKVRACHYGEMQVPDELTYVQSVKMGGREDESMVINDIAEYLSEIIQDDTEHLYVMGSGSTVAEVMSRLGLPNTLLGVDVVQNGELIATDCNARQLLALVDGKPTRLIITAIGGQGHVFGRGNQQLSPAVLRTIGRDNIWIAATKQKLQQLDGRPLRSDTGDESLDAQMAGIIAVITGYDDRVYYPLQ
ncbi:ATP-NAD kinase family protein [Alteromonas lipolytica]|uniref:ATP-NAD kinase n=1 Tax=Alteromonas lipolytica TaxID=1856405 RepID=A0A1E8FFR7_9ALTE|nr:ATP-NAD kinase family protein [Alteromonas lipolytica]OFI34749.1 ATP-NAD kinase [Alteromonas lipolytica]GGF53690.1 ATP-NAD kinase [Alteromonas lipolytica]